MTYSTALLCLSVVAATGFERQLHEPAEIKTAREAIVEYPAAKSVVENLYAQVQPFLERSPQQLWEMVPPPEVPRAFNASFEGCPCHGRELFDLGNYSWKIDPWNHPWRVTCPLGGEQFPSNDFGAFLASGMRDRSLLTGEWADDGWGVQVSGEPKKRWFIAYYCHWYWMNHLIPGITNLSRIYLLNGDEECALRAMVLLDRIADFYPRLDYNAQSRYAQEFYSRYTGKIVNRIWECGVTTKLCEAYDNIRPALAHLDYSVTGAIDPVGAPGDVVTRHRTGPDVDRAIRERFVRTVLEGVFTDHPTAGIPDVRGNFGMHQETALVAALVLDDPAERERVLDYLLGRNTDGTRSDSIAYCLDNMIFRDGIGYETAPGYCYIWTNKILTLSPYLAKLGANLYRDPRVARLFSLPLDMTVCGGVLTPTIGDFANAVTGVLKLGPEHAYAGFRRYGDPEMAWVLMQANAAGDSWANTYERLFLKPPDRKQLADAATSVEPPTSSSIFCDYGASILRQGRGEDQIAICLQYGQAAGHGHMDRLGIEVIGFGEKLVPDFGYPQFASEEKQTFAWDRHTSSHALVVVDESRQRNKNRGKLLRFSSDVDRLGFSYAEANNQDVYPQTEVYRRAVALVAGPPRVIIDVFWVQGGEVHDWLIRGFDAPFSTKGLSAITKRPGTLAGEKVAFAALHDDPELDDPAQKEASKRTFSSYIGSGYSYLDDVSVARGVSGWYADWRRDNLGVRIHMLGDGVEDVALCRGRPPRRDPNPESLRFVRLRNQPDSGEGSVFVALIEPNRGNPCTTDARLERSSMNEVTVAWMDPIMGKKFRFNIESDRVFLTTDGQTGAELRTATGHVKSVEAHTASTDVECTIDTPALFDKGAVCGECFFTDPAESRRAYPVKGVGWTATGACMLRLGYEPWIGRNTIEAADAGSSTITLRDSNHLSGGGRFRNTWAVVEGSPPLRVDDVRGTTVHLTGAQEDALAAFTSGADLRFTDIVPGQPIELSVVVEAE